MLVDQVGLQQQSRLFIHPYAVTVTVIIPGGDNDHPGDAPGDTVIFAHYQAVILFQIFDATIKLSRKIPS